MSIVRPTFRQVLRYGHTAKVPGGDLPWEPRGAPLLWTPLRDPGLQLWARADLGTSLSGAETVAREDQSRFGRDLARVGTGPTWVASDANLGGKSSDDFTPLQMLRSPLFVIPQPFVTYHVVRNDAVDTRVIFDTVAGPTSTTVYILGTWRLNAGADLDSGIGGTQNRIIRCLFNDVASAIYVDNFTTAANTGAGGPGTTNGVTVGANRDVFGNGFNGQIAETILTTSTGLVSEYRQYFNSRAYGVVVT